MPNLSPLEIYCRSIAEASENRLKYLEESVEVGLEKVRLIMLSGKSKTQRKMTLKPVLPCVSCEGDMHGYHETVTVDDNEYPDALVAIADDGIPMLVEDMTVADRYDILQQFVNRRIRKTAT